MLEDQGIGVKFLVRAEIFFSLPWHPTGSDAHTTLYTMGTWGSFCMVYSGLGMKLTAHHICFQG